MNHLLELAKQPFCGRVALFWYGLDSIGSNSVKPCRSNVLVPANTPRTLASKLCYTWRRFHPRQDCGH
jgi:hypothetical protein